MVRFMTTESLILLALGVYFGTLSVIAMVVAIVIVVKEMKNNETN